MKYLLLLVAFTTSLLAITAEQRHCETTTYNIAKQYTKYPLDIVAIAYTESSCGRNILGDDGTSLGWLQIQVPTARDVIRWYPKQLGHLSKLSDRRLKTILLTHQTVQIQIATLKFEHHRKKRGRVHAIRKHNGYVPYKWDYYNRVIANKKWFINRKFKEKHVRF